MRNKFRGERKFYVTLPELYRWASDLEDDYPEIIAQLKTSFDNAQELFDGTLTYYDPQTLEAEGGPTLINYPEILDENYDLINIYFQYWEDRPIWRPVEVGKLNLASGQIADYNQAMNVVLQNLCYKIDYFVKMNKDKYLRLLQVLNYKYNPIENYNLNENGTNNTTFEGSRNLERTKQNIYNGVVKEGEGPLNQTPAGSNDTVNLSFNTAAKVSTEVNQVSDTQAGQIASGTPSAPTVTTGTQNETRDYTTTYDDSSTGRLQSYSQTDGTSAQKTLGKSSTDELLKGHIRTETPGFVDYKDSETFTNRKDKGDHTLKRFGNIGVMTTQQMIEQEKMVAEGLNIVKEFCEELNKEIFLQCYNF